MCISDTGAAIGNLSYGWEDNKNKAIHGITGTMAGKDSPMGSSGQQTIADYTSGTAATIPTYTCAYAIDIDEPVVRDGTVGLRFYRRCQQYSVNALTDSSGASAVATGMNHWGLAHCSRVRRLVIGFRSVRQMPEGHEHP